jgi:copper resistance protein D
LIIVTEFLLYITLAFVSGLLILNLVPYNKKPKIMFPKKWSRRLIILIPVLSFFPILPLILGYGDDIGYWNAIKMILFSYTIGKAWFLNIALTILLFFSYTLSAQKKVYNWLTLLFLILITGTIGASSHAAGLEQVKGLLGHSSHLLSVSIWGGTLLMVGFFTKDFTNREKFIKWFSPLAVMCLLVALIGGFITMKIDINTYTQPETAAINEYMNGWMVSFGEALLIKHLLIIPLVTFAFINRFIISKQTFTNKLAINWIKAEGIILLVIFSVTAFMGQQEPPHQVQGMLKVFGPTPLFNALYQGTIDPSMVVNFNFTFVSIVLFAIAASFLTLLIISAIKKRSAHLSFIFVLLFLISSYMGVILGVE